MARLSIFCFLLREVAQQGALHLAQSFAGLGRDYIAPDSLHDVFRRVGIVRMRRSDRPAHSNPVVGELLNENPPAETVRQSGVVPRAAGEVLDFARPRRAQAKISPWVVAKERAV